jgi:hypothetical protein
MSRIVASTSIGLWATSSDGVGFDLVWRSNLGVPFGLAPIGSKHAILAVRGESAGTYLFAIDTHTWEATGSPILVPMVKEVHGIAVDYPFVYLTNTRQNSIHVFNLLTKQVSSIINFGVNRFDINHINAVVAHKGHLLIGLNNRGKASSQIVRIPLATITPGIIDFTPEEPNICRNLRSVLHSHDIYPHDGFYLVSNSHAGLIMAVRQDLTKPDIGPHVYLNTEGRWTRGITVDSSGVLWVGESSLYERNLRHEIGSGQISSWKFNGNSWEKDTTLILPESGQVHTLITLDT